MDKPRGLANVTEGFGRRRVDPGQAVPPGQYMTQDFPPLSAGPTPRVAVKDWELTITTGPRPSPAGTSPASASSACRSQALDVQPPRRRLGVALAADQLISISPQ